MPLMISQNGLTVLITSKILIQASVKIHPSRWIREYLNYGEQIHSSINPFESLD